MSAEQDAIDAALAAATALAPKAKDYMLSSDRESHSDSATLGALTNAAKTLSDIQAQNVATSSDGHFIFQSTGIT